MNQTAADLQTYYTNLLISQYVTKPRANATIGALMVGDGDFGVIANAIYGQVRDAFNLETAAGKQLDTLGKFRGVTRRFFSVDLSKVFLPLVDYDDPDAGTYPGIANYDDAVQPPATYTMTYEDFVGTVLQDGDFRRVIQFLAAVQSSDYAYATLDAICYASFSGNVNLKVTGNMQILYQHLTSDTDDLFKIIHAMGFLPAPAGVGVTVAEVGSF
ncbi:MAG: DUF2612 domain-containing protein [bacterium]